jgi:protein subunit release factor A
MSKINLEIRFGEGGLDAKIFVAELATAYLKLADRKN